MEVDQIILTIIRLSLGITFFSSSLQKMKSPLKFATTIRSFQILPRQLDKSIALMIIVGETLISVWITIGWQVKIVGLLYACLLLCFMTGVSINLIRGRNDLDCGCFGEKGSQKVSIRLLIIESILLCLSIVLTQWGGGYYSYDSNPGFWKSLLYVKILVPVITIPIGAILIVALFRHLVRIIKLNQ